MPCLGHSVPQWTVAWGLVAAIALVCGCERRPLTSNGVVGHFGMTGLSDGDFSYPRAIAAADDGTLFVADKSGRIQRFAADGAFELSWYMPEWRSGKPVGMTVHADGRLFVADTHYNRVTIFNRDGTRLGDFGTSGSAPGEFGLVTDVAIDAAGFIYVSEYGGNDRITKWTPQLTCLEVFGDEPVFGKRLSRPAGLAIDDAQTLWVADACNHRVVRFDLEGTPLEAIGELGTGAGQLRWPYDIAVCRDGSLLVSEFGNNRLQWFEPTGQAMRTWGTPGRRLGELFAPWAAIEGPNGHVYVVDSMNNRVQIVRL